jgi:hypothetical protein
MLNSYPSHHYQSPSQTHKRVENTPLPPETNLKIERELEVLEHLISDGVNLPFSKLTIIDRDRILNQLHLIRNCLPQALNRAIEILHRRQEIIEEADIYSHNFVRSAQE